MTRLPAVSLRLALLVALATAAACGMPPTTDAPASSTTQPTTPETTASTTGAISEVPRESGAPPDVLPAALAMSECMEERGWPGSWTGDGGYQFDDYPEEQTMAHLEDFDFCVRSTGLHGSNRLSDEQWLEIYDALLDAADCLRAEGHEIPSAPSFEVFIEDPGWTPYEFVSPATGVSPLEWDRLNEVCPQP